MKLRLVGCSHHNTSLATREQLALAPDQLAGALHVIQSRFPATEAVLLSTCNRVEFYSAAKDPVDCPSHDEMVSLLAENRCLDPGNIRQSMFTHADADVAHHLFMVASSLDSMVVGESQILSQVKKAFLIAAENRATGPLTHRIFEKANYVAKRVSTETSINRKRVSIASVAVAECARQVFERFDDKHVLVLGAGQIAEETLKYLQGEGVADIVIANRSRARAEKMADAVGGSVVPWDRISDSEIWADLIVSATAATEPIITAEEFRALEKKRRQRPLLILDLAAPRDFDQRIGDFGNVYLYNIDDLRVVCDAHRESRRCEWAKAARIVDEEVKSYLEEQSQRELGSTIRCLTQQAHQVKKQELARLLNKLGDLDRHARDQIEQSFDRIVNKLLHPPLESLRHEAKQGSAGGLENALRRLFQIQE